MTATTDYETAAAAEYDTAVSGIPDCFDCLDTNTAAELIAYAPLLAQWWMAIDSLDAAIGGAGDGEPPSRPAALRISSAISDFMRVRQHYLLALARATGVKVPQPDQDDGTVTTSNNWCGYFGYHDPHLAAAREERS